MLVATERLCKATEQVLTVMIDFNTLLHVVEVVEKEVATTKN